MYTFLIVLILVLSVALCLIVLIQKSKGGGLASGFSSTNQIMGVPKMTDFIEKLTWGLAAGIVILSIATVYVLPSENAGQPQSIFKDSALEQPLIPEIPAATTAPVGVDINAGVENSATTENVENQEEAPAN